MQPRRKEQANVLIYFRQEESPEESCGCDRRKAAMMIISKIIAQHPANSA
jgi:hypothetical protein